MEQERGAQDYLLGAETFSYMGLHLEGTMRKQVQGRAMGMRKSYLLRGGADCSGAAERLGTKVTDPLLPRAGMCVPRGAQRSLCCNRHHLISAEIVSL